MSAPALVLASASPRRAQLLAQIGVSYVVMPAGLDEQRLAGEPVERCVRRLAEQKGLKVRSVLAAPAAPPAPFPPGVPGLSRAELAALPVLGADTAVLIDGQMLGQPSDREAALQMLGRLSGRVHVVLSAVALVSGSSVRSALSRSEVRFRPLARAECAAYWDSGEPRGRAGGYAIQGLGAVFIEQLHGSYSGVMGLPLFETAALLAEAGVPVWGDRCHRPRTRSRL